MKTNIILEGNCLLKLKELPDESVDLVVTSPPYWGLRDYGVREQLGLESDFKDYLEKLFIIFDEVKRVLKKRGSCWVNLGDTYAGSCKGVGSNIKESFIPTKKPKENINVKNKSLVGIPQRFMIGMIDRGWICRNNIIWHKNNAMPSSDSDRFTVDFENFFFFTKNKNYYFEQQFESLSKNSDVIYRQELRKNKFYDSKKPYKNNFPKSFNNDKKNRRAVWSINTKPFKESHFAVYPEKLIEPIINSCCPKFICNSCGLPRIKILEYAVEENKENFGVRTMGSGKYSVKERKGFIVVRKLPSIIKLKDYLNKWKKLRGLSIEQIENSLQSSSPHHWFSGESFPTKNDWLKIKSLLNFDDVFDDCMTKEFFKNAEKCKSTKKVVGLSDCGCNKEFKSGIVLDPFFGSGTTGIVALKQRKNFIGIELNKEYIDIANSRLKPFLEQKGLEDYRI